MTKRKLMKILVRDYGQIPDRSYFAGDIERIHDYFIYRQNEGLDDFLIDDTTSADLDIDRVFKRVNNCQSSSGEQYLYYMLRSPCVSGGKWDKRKRIIDYVESNPKFRLSAQLALARLGKSRYVDLTAAFAPQSRSPWMLLVYIACALLFVAAVYMLASSITNPEAFQPLWFFALFINPLVHMYFTRKIMGDIATVNYCAGMLVAAVKINKLLTGELGEEFLPMSEASSKLKSIRALGGVCASSGDDGMLDAVNAFLLLDLISYEFNKNRLGKHHGEIFAIHEHVGMLDSAISVASYRKSVKNFGQPEIDFAGTEQSFIFGDRLLHPLIDDPVSNPIDLKAPALITGSNASGKSTYLKTVALNAIMAQSICTCLGSEYKASALHIFSSMAISDDLLAGESYYISQIKSLKRILDYTATGNKIFCVIDEVLRGTNTVERIAASSEVLRVVADKGVLCIAATHDLELCSLLPDRYDMYHFEEQIDGDEMTFDYRLKKGPASSRNAIKLLALMGFQDDLVKSADRRAQSYINTGAWTME